jgi:hypothetical protein
MIGAIFLIILLFGLSQPILGVLANKNRAVNKNLLNNLYWYHFLFWLIYYLYALGNRSDSRQYYFRSSELYTSWSSIYNTGTAFIDFVAYPFAHNLGFTYEMTMVLFAWFGYLGFVYFYAFFKENMKFKHDWNGYDLITLIIFLPNMHFWTASLGKGSLIFFGISLATYGLSQVTNRKILLLIGLAIVYHVRPHLFFFMALGIVLGLLSGRAKVPFYQKIIVFAAATAAIFLLYNKILAVAALDSDNVVQSFEDFSAARGASLAQSAGSGVNLNNYPLPLKLLTFWFRPLFADAPGILGLIVSFENLFYLILFTKIISRAFVKFIISASSIVKANLIIFLVSSIALSMVMGNLGIIMRQKSMVMYSLFFVILAFLDDKKLQAYQRRHQLNARSSIYNKAKIKLPVSI